MRISDWSSDVCSSDLRTGRVHQLPVTNRTRPVTSGGSTGRVVAGNTARSRQTLVGNHAGQLHDGVQACNAQAASADRKSDVEGKGVSVRVDLGGRRGLKNKKTSGM